MAGFSGANPSAPVGAITAGESLDSAFVTYRDNTPERHRLIDLPLIDTDIAITASVRVMAEDGGLGVRPLHTVEENFDSIGDSGVDLQYTIGGKADNAYFTSLKADEQWGTLHGTIETFPQNGEAAEDLKPQHVFEVPLEKLEFSRLAVELMSMGRRAQYAYTEDFSEAGANETHIGIAMFGVDISSNGIVIPSEQITDDGMRHVTRITSESSGEDAEVDVYFDLDETQDTLTITVQGKSSAVTTEINSQFDRERVPAGASAARVPWRTFVAPIKDVLPPRINYIPFQERVVTTPEVSRRVGFEPINWPRLPWRKIGAVLAVVGLAGGLAALLRSCEPGSGPKGATPAAISCIPTGFEVPGDFTEQIASMTPDAFVESLREQGLSAENSGELQQLAGALIALGNQQPTPSQLDAFQALGVVADHSANMDTGALRDDKTGVFVDLVCDIPGWPFDKSYTHEATGPQLARALVDLDTQGILSDQQIDGIVRLLMAVRNRAEMDPDTTGNPSISDWQNLPASTQLARDSRTGTYSLEPLLR